MKNEKYSKSSLVSEALVDENKNGSIVQISSDNDFYSIYVSKYRMNKEVGFGRKLPQMFEDFHLYYRHIPSGADALNVVLHENQLHQDIESELIQRISSELSADKVTIKRNLALIMLIGGKMNHNVDSIARAAKVLAKERINIEMIHMSQGSSKISLIFGVKAHDEKKAVAALHNEFFAGVSV
jgi:aspartate kinase